jgi:dienelactone hydrolase
MKYNFMALWVCFLLGLGTTGFAQEDLSVYNYWKQDERTAGQLLYRRLSNTAFQHLEKRQGAVSKLVTRDAWQKRQAEVRLKLSHAVGPFPEKTPLNPVITGTLKKEGFIVEKLYYESRPGYHVTAALFIPDQRQKKAPAIIFCSGHSQNGFRSEAYQKIILNYVKKGFIVLAFDPIGQGERIQYQPHELKSGPVSDHSYSGVQSFISGIAPANYFIWDGIRSVDYLISRTEVDPARIGIAGRSGGGTQSAYIAAMDDRILAAAPECYITSFEMLIRSAGPQDAEQNLMYGIKSGIDMADFLEVRAPKPALIVSTTRDMFSIQGARDAFAEAKKAYHAFGKADQLQMTEDDAGHASTVKNREASYAFFQKYLNNPGSSADLDVVMLTDEELQVTASGSVIESLKSESLFSLNKKYTGELLDKKERRKKTGPEYTKDLISKVVSVTGYRQPDGKSNVVFSGRMHRTNYAIEKYLVKGSGDYFIPVLWLKPQKGTGRVILLLDEEGKSQAAGKEKLADQLASQGYEVVIPDLSGIGELGNGYIQGGDSVIEGIPINLWFSGMLIQKSLVAVRSEEIKILTGFIKESGSAQGGITGVALGTVTSDLLHAAFIHDQFNKVVLIQALISYHAMIEERLYKPKYILSSVPGSLPAYDLPDLAEVLSTKGLLLINPVAADGKEIDQARAGAVYHQAVRKRGNADFIKTKVKYDELANSIALWMK